MYCERLDGALGPEVQPHPLICRLERFRANVVHIRQLKPDAGLGFRVKVLKTFQVVPYSVGSGRCAAGSNRFVVQETGLKKRKRRGTASKRRGNT